MLSNVQLTLSLPTGHQGPTNPLSTTGEQQCPTGVLDLDLDLNLDYSLHQGWGTWGLQVAYSRPAFPKLFLDSSGVAHLTMKVQNPEWSNSRKVKFPKGVKSKGCFNPYFETFYKSLLYKYHGTTNSNCVITF